MNALVVTGASGVAISVAGGAVEQRDAIVSLASTITAIDSPEAAKEAVEAIKELRGLEKAVEKSREEVKLPVRTLAADIDATARAFVAPINFESTRLQRLLQAYQERAEAERKAAERRRQEEIRAAQQERDRQIAAAEAERKAAEERAAAAAAAETADPFAEAEAKAESAKADAAAEQKIVTATEEARQTVNAVIVATSSAIAPPKPVGMQVRKTPDFEIKDLLAFANARPDLVTITPNRAAILAEMRKVGEWEGRKPLVTNNSADGWWSGKVVVA